MKCTACEKELSRRDVLYTEDKQPYCVNPFTCNDKHPNSVKNILARGGAIELFTEEELEKNLFENLDVPEEMKERIIRVATKPQSIRLNMVEIAHYVLELQDRKKLESISEAVRYCIRKTMADEPLETMVVELPDFDAESVEEPEHQESEHQPTPDYNFDDEPTPAPVEPVVEPEPAPEQPKAEKPAKKPAKKAESKKKVTVIPKKEEKKDEPEEELIF